MITRSSIPSMIDPKFKKTKSKKKKPTKLKKGGMVKCPCGKK